MGLQETISAQLLDAMRQRDAVRTGTLRLLISAFRYKEIENKKALSDPQLLEVIQSEGKRRRESMSEYLKANRPDLL